MGTPQIRCNNETLELSSGCRCSAAAAPNMKGTHLGALEAGAVATAAFRFADRQIPRLHSNVLATFTFATPVPTLTYNFFKSQDCQQSKLIASFNCHWCYRTMTLQRTLSHP